MHCDDAFELLTDAAGVATDAQHGALAGHLAQCADCRALAAAIGPAAELLREASSCDAPATVTTAQNIGVLPEATPWRRMLAPLGLYVAAASAAIVVLTFALLDSRGGDGMPRLSPGDVRQAAGMTDDAQRLPNTRTLLASLGMSDSCWRRPADSAASSLVNRGSTTALACCTTCHHAASKISSPVALASVAQSCQACHN